MNFGDVIDGLSERETKVLLGFFIAAMLLILVLVVKVVVDNAMNDLKADADDFKKAINDCPAVAVEINKAKDLITRNDLITWVDDCKYQKELSSQKQLAKSQAGVKKDD